MNKTAFAVISLVMLFSTVFISQLSSSANANPNWRPWENPISYPILDVVSPVDGGSYPSNDVWLNFTVTKPSDWFTKSDCYISYVTYCIDGSASGPYGYISDNSDENETIIAVQDKGVENPPTSFSFSFKLEGLTYGTHTLEILVEGNYNWTGFGYTFPRTIFTVRTSFTEPTPNPEPTPMKLPTAAPTPTSTPTPSPTLKSTSEPTPTLVPLEEASVDNTSQYLEIGGMFSFTVAVVLVGLGLLVYRIKKKR